MSIRLADYQEEIQFRPGRGREVVRLGRRAYRLDGPEGREVKGPDLRADAGLDGLSCCDYLRLDNNRVVLMEMTDLSATMDQIEHDLERVRGDEDQRRKFIRDTVRERVVRELALKVCGAMLLLCRAGVEQREMRHVFWLVVDGDSVPALRRMDSAHELKDAMLAALCGDAARQSSLQGGLRGAKLVDQAELITVAELRTRLPGPKDGD